MNIESLTGPKSAEDGDPGFMNSVPDPLLAGKALPTLKFPKSTCSTL